MLMSSYPANKQLADYFKVVSVEKSEAPQGAGGNNWHRYVIERGNSQIIGNMRGSLEKVTSKVSEYVENLNLRSLSPKGRSQWTPSTNQQKQPPQKVKS
jgi:hypothetical protein